MNPILPPNPSCSGCNAPLTYLPNIRNWFCHRAEVNWLSCPFKYFSFEVEQDPHIPDKYFIYNFHASLAKPYANITCKFSINSLQILIPDLPYLKCPIPDDFDFSPKYLTDLINLILTFQ